MYVGHFAIGLAIKAYRPQLPALPIMLGVGFIDVLDGLFVMLGINQMVPNPQALPYLYFDLTFIDWDHSLLMAALWSLVWAALFLKNKQLALWAGIAAFSHFIADWPMHNNDLALYPHAATHLGLGLWGKLGVGAWLLEGAFAAALAFWFWRVYARRGADMRWVLAVLAVLFVQVSPWLSPFKYIGLLDEATARILGGSLVAIGFVVPALLMAWLMNRAERLALAPRGA